MLLMSFFTWWYGPGWFRNFTQSKVHIANFSKNFSVSILFKTLFAPWKQIYSTAQGRQTAVDKFTDQLISRLVGFAVRSMTLLFASLGLLFIAVFQLLWILLWPFLPMLVVVALLYSAGVL